MQNTLPFMFWLPPSYPLGLCSRKHVLRAAKICRDTHSWSADLQISPGQSDNTQGLSALQFLQNCFGVVSLTSQG